MPHTLPDRFREWTDTWEEAPGKEASRTQLSHLLFNKWMGTETQGRDDSTVSINKKWGQSTVGPVPAQPHINNQGAERGWKRAGQLPALPTPRDRHTDTTGTQTSFVRGASPACHTSSPKAPDTLGVAGPHPGHVCFIDLNKYKQQGRRQAHA